MSTTDDPRGFPAKSRGGRRSADVRRQQAREADDWRHPDPRERYADAYDRYEVAGDNARTLTPHWRSAQPEDNAPPYRGDPRSNAAQAHQYPPEDDLLDHDPFSWDEPSESAGEPDYHDPRHVADRGAGAPTAGYDESMLRRLGRLEPDPEGALAERRRAEEVYEDSALHAGEEGNSRYAAEPFTSLGSLGEDRARRSPSELHERYFTEEPASSGPEADPMESALEDRVANVYDFDAHRSSGRAYEDAYEGEGSYGWDDYEQEAPPPAILRNREPDEFLPEDDGIDADFFDGEDEPEYAEPVEPVRKRGRKMLVAGVLLGAVAVGGGAAYVYKTFGSMETASTQPPTLLADGTPVKESPADPGGKEFPHGNKLIYDRLSGKPAQEEPKPERVASSDRTRSDAEGVPGIILSPPKPEATLEERIEEALRKAGKTADDDSAAAKPETTDFPKPVRTLVVRPDGTIVEPPSAEKTATSAEREAGAVAATGSTTPQESSKAPKATSAASAAAATGTGLPSGETSETAARPRSETGTTPPAPEAAPQERPKRVAALPKETASEPAASTSVSTLYFVQVAARKDQTAALAAFADLQQKYPSILNGMTPTIKKADLGDKGVWYRLWVGPMANKDGALEVCGKLKTAGLKSCFVRAE